MQGIHRESRIWSWLQNQRIVLLRTKQRRKESSVEAIYIQQTEVPFPYNTKEASNTGETLHWHIDKWDLNVIFFFKIFFHIYCFNVYLSLVIFLFSKYYFWTQMSVKMVLSPSFFLENKHTKGNVNQWIQITETNVN